ncbi:hypothetical protein DRN94_002405 [archaeon]|nr:hypothetical protein [archaeon]
MSEVVVSGEGKVLKEVNREIRDAVAAGKKVVVEKVNRIHGVAAGLRNGEEEGKGDVGD